MKKYQIFTVLFFFCLILAPFAGAKEGISYRRDLRSEGDQQIYVVGARAPHLFMISRDLYGDDKNWLQIAQWNGIKPPYELIPQQHLVIKKQPIQSEANANRILIGAWKKAGRKDIADQIAKLDTKSPVVVVAPVEKTTEEVAPPTAPPSPVVPVVEAASPIAPVGGPVAGEGFTAKWVPYPTAQPLPSDPAADAKIKDVARLEAQSQVQAQVLQTPAQTPPIQPIPAKVVRKEEAAQESEKDDETEEGEHRGSRWGLGVSALAAMMRLESNSSEANAHNVLYSRINYGVQITPTFEVNSRWAIVGEVSIEHLDIMPGNGGTIEDPNRNLLKFGIGSEYEFTRYFSLMASFQYSQEPDIRLTPSGVAIDGIYVPQLGLEDKIRLIGERRFTSWFVTEARWMLPVRQDGHDLKNGFGCKAGFDFESEFGESGSLTYGIFGKYIAQDTSDAVNNERTGEIELGWQW